jgi:DMSO/TMAO reductase YedYZ heme-binding membrane subunit
MLLAIAGTLALCMVVVTSVRRARRRLLYESWHLIHLYGYLGAGLALPHQLWTGADFLQSPHGDHFLVECVCRVRHRRPRLPNRGAPW